jgi:ABC-type sugar transport system permease subunit
VTGQVGRALADGIFLLPAVALVGLVIIIPGLYAMAMSVFEWTPGFESEFVGLDNFAQLLGSRRFHQVVGNQLVLALGIPLWSLLPLVIAYVLYERVPAPGVFRTILFFPAILSVTVVGILFRAVLVEDGLLNQVLAASGLSGLTADWLNEPDLVKPTLIVVLTWASLGLGVTIMAAALSAVGRDQFDAAMIDGASWRQRLRHIAFPHVLPTLVLWTVFQIVGLFLFTFGWIYVLTFGGPAYSSTTIDYDIYTNAMRNGLFGLAAAESVLALLLVSLILGVAWLVFRRTNVAEPLA